MRRKGFRWWIGLAIGFVLALAVIRYGKPLYLFTNAWLRDKPVVEQLPPGYADDASRMNRARVAEITVRNVKQDNDTFLRYADQDMFALVMLFNQARTQEDDRRMEEMTQELIDAALASGGRYYLPYRLHATKAQFEKAYPQARAWFERKRHYDPDGIFQNQFYSKYGLP